MNIANFSDVIYVCAHFFPATSNETFNEVIRQFMFINLELAFH